MTLHEITLAVQEIANAPSCDSRAHVLEDTLYRELLEYFAAEAPEQFAALAREALKSQELNIDRWYE